eukprot:Rmarinus@m.21096
MPPPVPNVPEQLPEDLEDHAPTDVSEVQEKIEKQGWLVKEGHLRKNWKRRWFILQGDTLTYYESQENMKKPKGVINLETCAVNAKTREDIKQEVGTTECMEIVTSERKLHFVAEGTTDMQEWVRALKNRITFLNYLKKLRAMCLTPDPRVVRFFMNPDVTLLVMEDSPLTLEAVFAIAEPLRGAEFLQRLSLRNCSLPDIAMKCDLAESLRQSTSLEYINLAENELGPDAALDLANVLQFNKRIKVLCLDDNRLGDKGVATLAEVLPTCALTHLSLASNDITDDGVSSLCKALLHPIDGDAADGSRFFPSIRLSRNVVSDAGAKELAELCVSLPSVTTLLLDHNQISNSGAESIADTLIDGECSVTDINLAHNAIGNPGGQALARMLAAKPHITSLDLSSNRVGEEGLLSIFQNKGRLETFDLTFERRA